MGAGALIRQAQDFDGGANASWIATYGEWCVEAMTLAHERWEALGRPAEVSRGDWFEIFNEYTIIVAGGHFVSLPMDEFSRLQRYAQDRKAKAPTDVAFVLMALLGAGDPQHKADVIFSMYEQGGVVTPERMAPLMAALVKAIHALGLAKQPETREQVGEQLASAPMSPRLDVADIVKGCYDRDGTPLDKDAFWFVWRNKRAIVVHAIEEGPDADKEEPGRKSRPGSATRPKFKMTKKKSAKRLDPVRSLARQERCQKRYSVQEAHAAREKEYTKTMERRRSEAASRGRDAFRESGATTDDRHRRVR